MKSITILLLLFACTLFSGLHAQSITVPNYKFDKDEDFKKYEPQILECINWLNSQPMTVEPEKRKAAEKFILEWIIGTPDVSVELNTNTVNFSSSSANLIVYYFAGAAKYILDGGEKDNKVKITAAGLRNVIAIHTANKFKKDKSIEVLIKQEKNGNLDAWIKEQLSK